MAEGTPKTDLNVLVIGGGPAGLMAAIAAASNGARVAVCERNDQPGLKLLATGGGRCNLTNTAPADEFMAAFGRHGRFIQPALAAMDGEGLRAFFDGLGVPTFCEDGFHVYPRSNRARDVRDALVRRCGELGVTIITGARVTALITDGGAVKGVETPAGPVLAPRVIITTGGKSYAELGSTGDGYAMAAAVGHTIAPLVPALVGLVTRQRWPAEIAGVSIPAVRVWIDLPGQPKAGKKGDILFTHTGVSGPAVLDISGDVAELLAKRKEVPIRIDLSPGAGRAQWRQRLDDWGHGKGWRAIGSHLAAHVPSSVAGVLCRLAGIDAELPAAEVSRAARNTLANLVTGLPLTITATEGFDHAMVTRGGVALKEVDPRTLASKIIRGLYFAGEALDLDGPCGGYNLQWALSSGHLAGLN